MPAGIAARVRKVESEAGPNQHDRSKTPPSHQAVPAGVAPTRGFTVEQQALLAGIRDQRALSGKRPRKEKSFIAQSSG
jgi:hypothetical protein